MEKNKRSSEEVIVSFFPNIDIDALREILKDDPIKSPAKKRKSINDEALLESAKNIKFATETFYSECENEKLDKMFAEREKKYIRNVKKSVTSKNLPTSLAKEFEIPGFLKNNILKIYKITGKSGHYATNRLRVSALRKDNIIFALYVTGSEDTDYCFKLLTKNFSNISENHKSVFVYIVPNLASDSSFNYKNKKDIIINKYTVGMRNLDVDRFFFSTEPAKPKEFVSDLAQYYKHCSLFPFSYSLFGFSGLKGPKGDKKELDRNLKFLMKYHKQPFIINKCDLFEKSSNNSILEIDNGIKNYSWLFIFDRINNNAFNCFKTFSNLVDWKKDKISALTLLNSSSMQDDIKEKFEKNCNENGLFEFSYTSEIYQSEASAIVKKKVNFGQEHYDFVVIYNSYNNNEVNRINYEKQNSSNYQIIMECMSNICVHNGI